MFARVVEISVEITVVMLGFGRNLYWPLGTSGLFML